MKFFLAVLCAGLSLSAYGGSQDLYFQCLTNFETYGETIWHSASYSNAPPDSGYWGDGATTGNGGIRGNAGVALAYAVMVLAQPSSPNNTTRLAHLRQALNYNALTHGGVGTNVAEDGHQWGWNTGTVGNCSESGSDWQTSLWTAPAALACFLQQSSLPPATVQNVQAMLISEANHRATVTPCSGWVGDTKAEETGWDGNVLAAAAAWLSTNTNASNWDTAAMSYFANTYTIANASGDPLASWITTVTAYPDWAIENHGFFHPEYAMVAGEELGDSWLITRCMNTNVSAALEPFPEHNVLNEWYSLNHSTFVWGELAYPDGEDWALHSYGEDSYMAWLAAHLNDPIGRYADNDIAQLERYRQSVNGNGQFVGPSGGGFYREAVQAYRTAMAWLQWNVADYPSGVSTPPPTAFEWLPDVDVIAQRNSNYFCSVSYGPQTNGSPSKIMAIIDPPPVSIPANTYLTTPREPGIIGLGSMGYPTSGGLVSLTTNANGFTAELHLTNGALGTTEVYINSTGSSVGIVEVPQLTAGTSGTLAGSFCVGVQNDPLSGGTRLLQWTGGSATVTNRTGISVNMTNNWVCVAGRYGVAAGPAGYFNYQAASGYTRMNLVGGLNESGVAEDTLQFFPANPTGARYAVWFPGNSPAQTTSNAALIAWTVNGSNATLSFPGIGGPAQITAVIPPPQLYPPYELGISSVNASSHQSSYPPTNAVDGNSSTFWVSSGVNPGQGPTVSHPEWLAVTFPRQVAVADFAVAPRTDNGGYGPKAVQMWLNGTAIYTGTMAPTSTLNVTLYPPIYATNAELYITSSYDPSYPTNSRNVQVVEMTFFERAQPGTYADWEMQTFTSTQLTNSFYEGPLADPDGDGVPNIMEFAVGGNPLVSDASLAGIQAMPAASGQFAFQFRQRKNLGDVTSVIESSSNLVNWTPATPLSTTNVADLGTAWLVQARFPTAATRSFFRIRYFWPGM